MEMRTGWVCLRCPSGRTFALPFIPTRRHSTRPSSSSSPVDAAGFEAGPSQPRSSIFDLPAPDPAHPFRTIRRRRVLEYTRHVEAGLSDEERLERAKRHVDPWHRMANSYKRLCIATRQVLPLSFLINLRPTRFLPDPDSPTSPSGLYLMPDRVLHPRYSPRKTGQGFWVVCRRDIVERLGKPGPHLALFKQVAGLRVSSKLAEQVESQLKSRVLHEVELLQKRLLAASLHVEKREIGSARGSTLRRLTQEEVKRFAEHGEIALGVVSLLDLSGLEDFRRDHVEADGEILLPSRVTPPVYRLSRLFPTEKHIELGQRLRKVLAVERTEATRARLLRRRLLSPSDLTETTSAQATAPQVASRILALSTWPTAVNAIEPGVGEYGVDLAIALWKLKSWYGEGWEEFQVDNRGKRI